MTTLTDSKDTHLHLGSHLRVSADGLMQSYADAFNRAVRLDDGKIVILVDITHSHAVQEITWEEARSGTPVLGYLTGPYQQFPPYRQTQGEVGTAMWNYDVRYWRAMQEHWYDITGDELLLGVLHRKTYIHSLGAEFVLYLSPEDPPSVADAYGQYSPRAEGEGSDSRHRAITTGLISSDEEFKAMWLFHFHMGLSGGGTPWVQWEPWAQEEYTNRVGRSWPLEEEAVSVRPPVEGTLRWLFYVCQDLANYLGPEPWPDWGRDDWLE